MYGCLCVFWLVGWLVGLLVRSSVRSFVRSVEVNGCIKVVVNQNDQTSSNLQAFSLGQRSNLISSLYIYIYIYRLGNVRKCASI